MQLCFHWHNIRRRQVQGAQFSGGTADFREATFSGGEVNFSRSQFSGGTVNFDGATFSGGFVDFDGATFSGGRVNFNRVTFSSTVTFSAAEFSGQHGHLLAGVRDLDEAPHCGLGGG